MNPVIGKISEWFLPIPLYPHGQGKCGSVFDVHLQWFAAEDEGRTEEPTEQKIRKAREEGKVAKSMDVSSSLVLLFPVVTLGLLAPSILNNLLDMLRFFFLESTSIDITTDARLLGIFFGYFLRIMLPIAAVAVISAIMGNLIQVGFLFSAKPITPDPQKIIPNFSRFFKRAFGSAEAAFNLGKAVLKILIIALLGFLNIQAELPRIVNLSRETFWNGFTAISTMGFRLLVEAAVIFLILSIPDYVFQRRQHRESLKMSKQELKEERRMMEGDPLVRSRLRERMRELLSRNMIQNVPKADVVITNPTHFAVAMGWNSVVMNAPTVIAKGQDNLAFKIREVAEESGVPLVENKPLARALYAEVEIGDAIPEKYYEVMALILAQVFRMKGGREEAI